MSRTQNEAMEVIREITEVWDSIYEQALTPGPHNPEGTPGRAEQLARIYMSGYLRTH